MTLKCYLLFCDTTVVCVSLRNLVVCHFFISLLYPLLLFFLACMDGWLVMVVGDGGVDSSGSLLFSRGPHSTQACHSEQEETQALHYSQQWSRVKGCLPYCNRAQGLLVWMQFF